MRVLVVVLLAVIVVAEQKHAADPQHDSIEPGTTSYVHVIAKRSPQVEPDAESIVVDAEAVADVVAAGESGETAEDYKRYRGYGYRYRGYGRRKGVRSHGHGYSYGQRYPYNYRGYGQGTVHLGYGYPYGYPLDYPSYGNAYGTHGYGNAYGTHGDGFAYGYHPYDYYY